MINLSIGVKRMIASGIAIIIYLSIMFVGVQALLSTSKMGLSINVSYDPLVTAKVYLATNSSTAINGENDFRQYSPTVDGAGETTAFDKTKAALVFNTVDTAPLTKDSFEALGSGASNGLKCDASGEMEFYVFVENYSTTGSVYYKANIDFVGTGDKIAPFSIETNPNFEVARMAGESFSTSILMFKVKSNNLEGLNANTLRIEILLQSLAFTGFGQYTSGTYAGKYYIELGNAPQTFAGTTSTINATTTGVQWVDGNYYYLDDNNSNVKYVLKNSNYYLVEPIRWVIIADENYPTDGGSFGTNFFSTTNLVNLDRTRLTNIPARQIVVVSEKLLTNFGFSRNFENYTTQMNNLKNMIFTPTERNLLKTIQHLTYRGYGSVTLEENFSLFGGCNEYITENFYVSSYLTTPSMRQATNTAYLAGEIINPTNSSAWWTKSYAGGVFAYYIATTGSISSVGSGGSDFSPQGVRPIFIINLDI